MPDKRETPGPLFDLRSSWSREGSRCPHKGCRAPRHATWMAEHGAARRPGPSGTWQCEVGHEGWIWPDQVVLSAAEPG